MVPNAGFWARHFRCVNVRTIAGFRQAIYNKVLPGFESISAEAEAVAADEFERLGQMAAFDDLDVSDVAEGANQAGVAFYEMMSDGRQALLNILSVSLHHLLEQQLLLFHRRNLLRPTEKSENSLFTRPEALKRLAACGIDCTRFKSWPKREELRLVANTVKHAEGSSSRELYALRPDLFVSPFDRRMKLDRRVARLSPRPVFTPLAGEDIYVTSEDLALYFDAASAFWNELADVLERDAA